MPTVLHRLSKWAKERPQAPAQSYKKEGVWTSLSSQDVLDRIYWLALFLESRGMKPGEVGTIFSYNRPDWVHADLAPSLLGAMSAGLYTNASPKEVHYILENTESRFLSVQNKSYFDRFVGHDGKGLPDRIEVLLVFEGDAGFHPKAVAYDQAIEIGKGLAKRPGAVSLDALLGKLDPNAGAIIIYTSGTTGAPKGAVLSHDNIVFEVDSVIKQWGLDCENAVLFSFLPLCHVAEKIYNIGVGIVMRCNVYYCTSFDNVINELPEVEPTILLCVPRVWEKMMEGVQKKIAHSPLPRQKLANWALEVGAKVSQIRLAKELPSFGLWAQWKVADQLVLSKVRKALGLSKIYAAGSGAAALSPAVCKWFRGLGVEITELYGLTESSAAITMTVIGEDCSGTVGIPISPMEVKLAEDGEIISRGRQVFKGYFRNPEATDLILKDGWLHTGDLAEWDQKGRLKIRGRKKEILKTSGGKMIAPVPIEEAIKADPMISQVCMVGDGRKFLAALVTLSEGKLSELSKQNGLLKGRVITAPQVLQEIEEAINRVNTTLASFEQIKKFAVLTREFSIAEGEMTPTLKMKRSVIELKYSDVIQTLYEA